MTGRVSTRGIFFTFSASQDQKASYQLGELLNEKQSSALRSLPWIALTPVEAHRVNKKAEGLPDKATGSRATVED